MRTRIHYPSTQFLNAKEATGASVVIPCKDYRNAVISVSAPLNASFTIKFAGSIGDTAFDATAAQSTTNVYDFLEVVDLQDGTAIDGDTGVTIDNTTAAVNCRLFEVNTNALDYVAVLVTAYTDGSVSASITLTDNA
jgi:hypothetical protein